MVSIYLYWDSSFHSRTGLVRYGLERVATQFRYDQGVPPILGTISGDFESCLNQFFLADTRKFVWGHPGRPVSSVDSEEIRRPFIVPSFTRAVGFFPRYQSLWQLALKAFRESIASSPHRLDSAHQGDGKLLGVHLSTIPAFVICK